jgi:hypothetical protein
MIPNYLRFSDLKERGIVNNWVTLQEWIEKQGFPPGKLVGPNTRIFAEPEVQSWLDRRPSDGPALRGAARVRHAAKSRGAAG